MTFRIMLGSLLLVSLLAPNVNAQPSSRGWSGAYAGGDIGLGWGTSKGTATNGAGGQPDPYDFTMKGPLYGGFAGGNWQQNRLVVGAEFDWQLARVKGDSGPLTDPLTHLDYTYTTKTTSYYASIRGRLGAGSNRWLIFGTAGWIWNPWSTAYAFSASLSSPFTTNEVKPHGLTFGGGFDGMVARHLFLRGEYRYVAKSTSSFTDLTHNAGEKGNDVRLSDLRFGVGVKF